MIGTHNSTLKPIIFGAAVAFAIGLGSVGATTTTVQAAPNTGLNGPSTSEWRSSQWHGHKHYAHFTYYRHRHYRRYYKRRWRGVGA